MHHLCTIASSLSLPLYLNVVTVKAVPTEEPTVYTSPLIWILAVLIAVLLVVVITFIVIVAA